MNKILNYPLFLSLLFMLFQCAGDDSASVDNSSIENQSKILGKWHFYNSYYINRTEENTPELLKCLRKSSYTFLENNKLKSEIFFLEDDICSDKSYMENHDYIISENELSILEYRNSTIDTTILKINQLNNEKLILRDLYRTGQGYINEKDIAIYEYHKID